MTDARHDTGRFTSFDDTDIFYQSWTVEEGRGLVVIAHGMGEHGGRYEFVQQEIAPLGFSMFAPDHRGHGRSGGRRGHVLRFSEWTDDLKTLIELAQARVKPARTFLLGHSMGGLIAINYALSHPETIDGLINSSPLLGIAAPVPKWKEALGRKLSALWPSFTMENGIDPNWVSRDPVQVKAYADDPLIHHKVSARQFTEMTDAMDRAHREAATLKLPYLLQVSGQDKLVDPDASRRFFDRAGSPDKTMKFYEQHYHEIYRDLQREAPLTDLGAWLSAHLIDPAAETQS